MREYTIRNKSKNPTLTLTPAMLALMLAARPESVSLVLAKLTQDYRNLTGKALSLDHEQTRLLLVHAGTDEKGTWVSKYSALQPPASSLKPLFTDGFMRRTLSPGLAEDLAVAESFHALLDTALSSAQSGPAPA